MTIFTTAAELLATGPQTLADLTAHVVAAGATRAQQPEATVRQALVHRAVELPDGRWANPALLLEGRVLTTRGRFPEVDLAPLRAARRWSRAYDVPRGLEEGPLRAYSLRDGRVHVENVDAQPQRELAALIGPLKLRRWTMGPDALTEDLVTRLWEHLDADPLLLTEPSLPLSECFPELEEALVCDAEEQQAWASLWRPTLELPSWMQGLADCLASDAGLTVQAYLTEVVTEALADDRQPAKLIALPRR